MNVCLGKSSRRTRMQLTPREFDKLLIYIVAEIALKRKANGVKLNYQSRPNRSHPCHSWRLPESLRITSGK